MAKQTDVFSFRGVNMQCSSLTASDGTDPVILLQAGGDDSVMRHLSCVNFNVGDSVVRLMLNDGLNFYALMTVRIPAAAGSNGLTGAFNVLEGGLLSFFRALPLQAGWSLAAAATEAVVEPVVFTAIADDF